MAAKVLLEHNANPEAYHDGEGNPGPLHAACLEGNIQIARCLVQAGADVNRLDWDACRPLHHAVRHDDPDLIRLLLHAGANPNVLAYDEHRSPLHKAATVGSLQSVKALITGGADPNGFRVRASCYEQRPEPDHLSPIGFAIINDHVDVVSELVQSNADLTHRMNFRKALSEVINKIPIREFNVKKNKEKLLGKFELNHPVFNGTMKPVKYSVLTEKNKIIGALMMSSQYSNNDVNSLIRLTEIHQLARSRQAINKHSAFIPPESLQVLAGRAVKQSIKKNCPDRVISACIQQLTIPENLQHFLQQPIDTNKLQN
ncbi:ankyrin repeat domain-containing protein [Endozoicomonas sp. SCSIO W0465]|nr:ankyrin repeat domain-containing protein [Endozoicomonas sp. SCSIO W0465]